MLSITLINAAHMQCSNNRKETATVQTSYVLRKNKNSTKSHTPGQMTDTKNVTKNCLSNCIYINPNYRP
jgi:hypothetical protein